MNDPFEFFRAELLRQMLCLFLGIIEGKKNSFWNFLTFKDLEIDGLKSRNESLVILVQESSKQQSTDTPVSVNQETKKSVMDNTNEILILKNKISDLEQKLSLAEVRQSYRRRFNSESQDSKMEQILVNGKAGY